MIITVPMDYAFMAEPAVHVENEKDTKSIDLAFMAEPASSDIKNPAYTTTAGF